MTDYVTRSDEPAESHHLCSSSCVGALLCFVAHCFGFWFILMTLTGATFIAGSCFKLLKPALYYLPSIKWQKSCW